MYIVLTLKGKHEEVDYVAADVHTDYAMANHVADAINAKYEDSQKYWTQAVVVKPGEIYGLTRTPKSEL